ncbi:MAG TPA: methyltransferase domain-containing protein [Stellaceae bacterium]|nr:methyltransferase domain-containing protein [Stellaceae bacterium]
MTDPAPSFLFDRRAWRLHRARAARQGAVDFLHREVGERLIDRLDLIGREFPVVLDLSTADLGLADRRGTQRIISSELVCDPELIPFRRASFDLVASNLMLHWVGDLPGALVQLRRVLRPGGLLLAALFGGQTLVELRTALFEGELAEEGGVSPRVSPTAALSDAAALLQRAGFAMPVADSETITVTYPDMLALMRDLRGMGETNALAARRRLLRRSTLARAGAIYAERFAGPDGRIPATFEVLFLTGWAPHPDDARPDSGARRVIAQH